MFYIPGILPNKWKHSILIRISKGYFTDRSGGREGNILSIKRRGREGERWEKKEHSNYMGLPVCIGNGKNVRK